MSQPDRVNCRRCQAKDDAKYDYQFYIAPPSKDNPGFIIGAQERAGKKKLSARYPSDLLLCLSSVLGNDNGKFDWGRTAFHDTGKDFVIEPNSDILAGQLLDLAGNYQPAHVHLRQQLQLDDRDNPDSPDPYHYLASKPLKTRTLILCFDGTSNHFSDKNTNVVKLVDLLKKDDPHRQMVYYQTGVGTYGHPSIITPAGLQIASALDEALAWYLYQHVIDGYRFLMQTYQAGDRIALFGFSRGAFTARALAGMLHSVGLLPAHNLEHAPFAYEVYKHGEEDKENKFRLPKWVRTDHPKPEDFKETFCIPVVIDFVGVWDTVASVGALRTEDLPHIDNNSSITVFRHALALDERRGNFIPSLWNHKETKWNIQNVREVWFRGEHCDVGGGSAGGTDADPKSYSMLSNISLRWMIQQIEDNKIGILFDHNTVKKYRGRGTLETPLEKIGDTLHGDKRLTSDELDKVDVVHDIYNSIGWRPLWNFLEYFGLTYKATQVPSKWDPVAKRFPNAKSGRAILGSDKYPIYIHSSVVYSMEKDGYRPRAEWYGYHDNERPRIEGASSLETPSFAQTQALGAQLNLVPGDVTRSIRSFVFFGITVVITAVLVLGTPYVVFRTIQHRDIFWVCRRVASILWPRF